MPFILSLKPQETEIVLPPTNFDKFDHAETIARDILHNYPGLYFVGIYFYDDETPNRLVTNLIQNGYSLYTWTQYKYFDKINRIKDFFVLNGNHYIKLKPFNDKVLNTQGKYYK
jgi:hypothetical protein